jgi:hypothetical protein
MSEYVVIESGPDGQSPRVYGPYECASPEEAVKAWGSWSRWTTALQAVPLEPPKGASPTSRGQGFGIQEGLDQF